MKILLISANVASTPYTVYPLGLSMVAGALRQAGHRVIAFDFLQHGQSLDKLATAIQRNQPDIVGISIRNIDNVNLLNEQRYIDVVKAIAQRVRLETKALVVLGGSGFSIMPQVILEKLGADYGIVGEGEKSMVDFVDNVSKGIFPKQRFLLQDYRLSGKEIPSAYYDPDIMEFYLKSGNVASVQTKRGCVHKCVYCSYPLLEGQRLRRRDPEDVIKDIQELKDIHRAKYIFFTDSVFNDDQDAYLEVLRLMKKNNINISWTAFFKPKGLDDEKIALMKDTGLKAAEIGADAACDTTLRKLGKPFLFSDVVSTNDSFNRQGIATAHYYMFGCPGETRDTVLEGINNIKSLKNTVSFIFMGIRILPNTALEQIAITEGLIKSGGDLLEPVYYIAPGINKEQLKQTLTDAFAGIRNCVFPPDALDSSLQFMHKLGYSGSLWDMLIPGNEKRNRKRKKSN
jgi:lipid biosynthesis B12-binding/radical SAM protein